VRPAPLARVAIAGATGFTGQELIRLLARHGSVSLTLATSSTSASAARPLPALKNVWDGTITPLDTEALKREADLVFLALPDAATAELVPTLVEHGLRVIDLSGSFRLRDNGMRTRWYPATAELPDKTAYGLTELDRNDIRSARLVANPGCYPTAALLALKPLTAAGILVPGADVIVDAKSGVSGAGKTPTDRTHFCECDESISIYGVFGHRHGAEIDQELGAPVTFSPHLVPLDRGLMATTYVRVPPGTTEEGIGDIYRRAYEQEPFIRLFGPAMPAIKHVAHTNFCDIGWRVDPSGRAIIVSVIDNLLKGASGQAVQNMNVMLGIDERTGLQ